MIDTVIVHCSASPQGRGDDAETIHRWHKEGRGWDGIGYHMVILEDGTAQAGRPIYWQGAHASGRNENSLGICLIGQGGDATNSQLQSLAQILIGWNYQFNGVEVLGHRDVDPNKSCPGFDVPAWWQTIK